MQSTTPVGTPPQDFISVNPPHSKVAAPAPDTSAILANLQALANMAKQNTNGPTVPGNPAQGSSSNVTFPQNTFSNMSSVNPNSSVPAAAHVNVPGAQNLNGVFSYPGMNPAPQSFVPNQSNGLPNVQAAPQSMMPQANGVSPEVLQQQLQLLQALRAQNVPQEQWAPLLAVLMANNAAGSVAAPTPAAYGTFGSGRDDASRDRNGYDQHYRSPPRAYRNRSRSRSPPRWDRGRESPPRRRDSPVYGEFGNDRNGKGGDYGRRGGAARGRASENGNGFRARSPDRFHRSPSPTARRGAEQPLPPPGPKWIQYDPSIGEGKIKGELHVLGLHHGPFS